LLVQDVLQEGLNNVLIYCSAVLYGFLSSLNSSQSQKHYITSRS